MDLYYIYEGLMTSLGLQSPLTRGVVGAALFSIPIFMHWGISYKDVGDGLYIPKKWSLLGGGDGEETTGFPWWIWPIFGYAFFSLIL